MLYYITAYIKQDNKYQVTDAPTIVADKAYNPADGRFVRSL